MDFLCLFGDAFPDDDDVRQFPAAWSSIPLAPSPPGGEPFEGLRVHSDSPTLDCFLKQPRGIKTLELAYINRYNIDRVDELLASPALVSVENLVLRNVDWDVPAELEGRLKRFEILEMAYAGPPKYVDTCSSLTSLVLQRDIELDPPAEYLGEDDARDFGDWLLSLPTTLQEMQIDFGYWDEAEEQLTASFRQAMNRLSLQSLTTSACPPVLNYVGSDDCRLHSLALFVPSPSESSLLALDWLRNNRSLQSLSLSGGDVGRYEQYCPSSLSVGESDDYLREPENRAESAASNTDDSPQPSATGDNALWSTPFVTASAFPSVPFPDAAGLERRVSLKQSFAQKLGQAIAAHPRLKVLELESGPNFLDMHDLLAALKTCTGLRKLTLAGRAGWDLERRLIELATENTGLIEIELPRDWEWDEKLRADLMARLRNNWQRLMQQ